MCVHLPDNDRYCASGSLEKCTQNFRLADLKFNYIIGTFFGIHILNLTDSLHCPGCPAFFFFHTIVNYPLHLKDSVLCCVIIFAH